MTSTNDSNHIPTEIAGLIMSYLRAHEVAKASAINRSFYMASEDEQVWQARLKEDWLHSSGQDNTNSNNNYNNYSTSSDGSASSAPLFTLLGNSQDQEHHVVNDEESRLLPRYSRNGGEQQLYRSSKAEYSKRWTRTLDEKCQCKFAKCFQNITTGSLCHYTLVYKCASFWFHYTEIFTSTLRG